MDDVAGWDDFDASENSPIDDGVTSSATLAATYPSLVPLGALGLGDRVLAPYLGTHEGGLVRTWLERGGCRTIGETLELEVEALLSWPGIGVGKRDRILALLDLLAGASTDVVTQLVARVAAAEEAVGEAPDLAPHLGVLREWGAFTARAGTWGEVEKALDRSELPADVATARDALRAVSTGLGDAGDPGEVLLEWIDGLDARERDVFESRIVRVTPKTLETIGNTYDVTRERVRQLEARLAAGARERYATDPAWRQVRWAGFLLEEHLGAFAPRSEVDTRSSAGEEQFDRHLLLWFAGLIAGEDAICRQGFELPRVEQVPFEEDDVIVDADALRQLLVERGVRESHLAFATRSIAGITTVDDVLVRWPKSVVDRACSLLAVRGQAMEFGELYEVLGGSERSVRQRLFEDPRLSRMSRTTIGLKSWGGEEYAGVVDAMMRRLEENDELSLDHLAQELAAQFGVSANSVHMCAAAPVFAASRGLIRLRGATEPYVPRAEPHRVWGLFQSTPDVLHWNVGVDADILRGSGRSVAPEIGTFLGVTPGVRTQLRNEVRDVPLGWVETNHTGPGIGSLKAIADDLGAQVGDVFQLRLDRRDRSLRAVLRPQEPVESSATGERLAWLTGLPEKLTAGRAAFADTLHVTPDEAEQALRKRSDNAVADAYAQL
ncbi:sigma factor-like helix-turn-helix DNA-binding protein [Nocardioides sp. CPCC 205120]|uniref:sigma factor-like helix-turn-helix DNA-binding protein n=1 Tax=Nocardioides sp. CPCC 205120 TaxID=3406462 RepID=UPI003B5146FE